MNHGTGATDAPSSPNTKPVGYPYVDVIIGSEPPVSAPHRGPRSVWPGRLAIGRANPGVWIQVLEAFTESSAAQLASDLRNAHARDPKKLRIRGVLPGEQWETTWGRSEHDPDRSHFFVWFRLIAPTSQPQG